MPLFVTYVYRINVQKFREYVGSENTFVRCQDVNSSAALKEKAYLGKICNIRRENDPVKGKHLTVTTEPLHLPTSKLNIHLYGDFAKKLRLLKDDLIAAKNASVILTDQNNNDPSLHPYSIVIENCTDGDNDPVLWIMTVALPGIQTTDEYHYSTSVLLHEHVRRKVNFFGIVIRANEIKQSRGTSFHCGLTVIDGVCSLMKNQQEIQINLFINSLDIPIILHGHIIRVHRAKVDLYENKITLTVFSENDFALFTSEMSGTMEAVTAANKFTFHNFDRQSVQALRIWWNYIYSLRDMYQRLLENGTTYDFRPLSSVLPNKYINIVCQVIDIVQDNDVTILRIWDGSKPPINLYKHPIRSEGEQNWKIPRDFIVDVLTRVSDEMDKIDINSIIVIKHLRCVSDYGSCWKLTVSNEFPLLPRLSLLDRNKDTYYRSTFKKRVNDIVNSSSISEGALSKKRSRT